MFLFVDCTVLRWRFLCCDDRFRCGDRHSLCCDSVRPFYVRDPGPIAWLFFSMCWDGVIRAAMAGYCAAIIICGAGMASRNRTVHAFFNFWLNSFSSVTFVLNMFCCLISGKRQIQAGDDGPEEVYLGLPCRKVERVGGFRLNRDDPANYTDKITSLVLCKDLKKATPLVLTEILLPKGRVLLLRACWACCLKCIMNCLNWQLMQEYRIYVPMRRPTG